MESRRKKKEKEVLITKAKEKSARVSNSFIILCIFSTEGFWVLQERGAEGSWAGSTIMKLITKAKPAHMKVCY